MPDVRNVLDLNMPPVSEAYENYQFLGHEFLTWLWFSIEEQPHILKDASGAEVMLTVHKKIVLKKATGKTVSILTVKERDEGVEEGMLALKGGAVVIEMGLSMKIGEVEWTLTLKGDTFQMNSLKPSVKMPKERYGTLAPENDEQKQQHDFEAAVLDKTYLYMQAIDVVDGLFKQFIMLRLAADWTKKTLPGMKAWIN